MRRCLAGDWPSVAKRVHDVLVLSDADVAQALSMRETLAALESSFAASAGGTTVSSPWVQLFVGSDAPASPEIALAGTQLRIASGFTPGAGVVAVRMSADILQFGQIHGSMRKRVFPAAQGKFVGLVMLFSVATGEPLALFPDAHIQHYRVGATNALGTKYLARRDAKRVGLLGAGWQAEARLEAYREIREIEEVRVFSPRRESRTDFAQRMTALLEIPVVAVDDPEQAIAGADIIAAATSSIREVIAPEWARPGVHIDCLRELEFGQSVIDRADVAAYNRRDPVAAPVVTIRSGRATTLSEGTGGGYPEISESTGWWTLPGAWDRLTTLEDLISGAHSGRCDDDDVTLFLSRGVAHQFSAVGAVVYERARAQGLGFTVPAELVLQDRPT